MCTVLQQHLNRQNGITPNENGATNGYNTVSVSPSPAGGRAESVALTPAMGGVSSYWVRINVAFTIESIFYDDILKTLLITTRKFLIIIHFCSFKADHYRLQLVVVIHQAIAI